MEKYMGNLLDSEEAWLVESEIIEVGSQKG
jgi:hypothetical protein